MKKSPFRCIAAALACMISLFAAAAEPLIYVLPIDDEIDGRAWQHTRRAIAEAGDAGADMLIVHLNTYGGAVDAADSIRTALLRLNIPTVAFIDHNAASAGALIALACDSVYMAPDATMGAATVVNGQGEPMPQKYQSYMSAIMRATAEQHGKYIADGDSTARWRRDPDVAASIVDPSKATTFTAGEAADAGFAEGTASDIPDVLSQLGYDDPAPRVHVFRATFTDDVIGFLTSAGIRAILIMLILGGIYMEMHSPGLGVAAAVALAATALYFLPMFITGTTAPWIVICFVLGVVLLLLEIFVIPGFGVSGVAGTVCIIASLAGVIINDTSLSGEGMQMSRMVRALAIVGAGIVGAVGILWYLTSSHGPKWMRRHSELTTRLENDNGFVGVDMSLADLVGCQARAVTDLRPAGKIEIDNRTYDAVSASAEYIDQGTEVHVVRFENAQLYVERADKTR